MLPEVDTDTRSALIRIAKNSDAVRARISQGIMELMPDSEFHTTEKADYSRMSEDELIAYLDRGAEAVRLFVDDFMDSVGTKLSSPIARMAMRSLGTMLK